MSTERFTIKPTPLNLLDTSDVPQFTVIDVTVAIRESPTEFRVSFDDLVVPGVECWFYVVIMFPWNRGDGTPDRDAVITDGTTFYVANTSLVPKKRRKVRIPLNPAAIDLIHKGIEAYVQKIC